MCAHTMHKMQTKIKSSVKKDYYNEMCAHTMHKMQTKIKSSVKKVYYNELYGAECTKCKQRLNLL